MKILLFGANGYMGQAFLSIFPDALTPRVDIADAQAVKTILDELKPDVVINAAGKTGRPNVDWCEDHKQETIRSNVTGPLVLLDELMKRNIFFVHLSSGCIYEGENGGRGFTEDDVPNFSGSFYSRTKSWTDQMLREFPVLQLRIRMPFDGSTEPRNLIQKLKKYERVLDVKNSLTYLPDLLAAANILIEKRVTGTFNVVNPGAVSPYDVMTMYKQIVDPAHVFEKLTLHDLSDVVKAGRSNCLLSTEKLKTYGIALPTVEERLKEALAALS